ncbi:MAG: DUF11 domain-containing protein, partial [Anaerolineae bacterium]|nr:DUF11 domain-containing protein [Anaerolineae bacterium]
LDPAQYGSFYVYARVLTGTAIGTVITNTALITTSDVDNGTYQNYAEQVNTVVTPTLDFYIYKTSYQSRFFLGENITYTINYANQGNWPAANVRITDTLPQGLTYYSATLEPLQVNGQEVVWEIPFVEDAGVMEALGLYTRQSGSFALGDTVTNTISISGTGAYGQVTQEDYLTNNYSEYAVIIGENQDTLWGSMPYVALAEGTGGHYIELSQASGDYYANVTNASDIVFTEMMRDADLEKQMTTITATTKTYHVNVDGYTEQVNFFLNGRPGSAVSMIVLDPSGAVVTESMRLPATQSISYTAAGTSEYYRVYDPTPGVWQAIISGTGTFAFSASANTSLMMRYLGDTSLPQGIPATVIARLEGEVRTASFSLVDSEGATLQTLQMYDDGLHDDGISGDGIYGGVWTPVDSVQHYLKVTGTDDKGYTFERIDSTPVRIQSMYVEASKDLTAEPGDTINYTFAIHNDGENDDTYYMVYKSTQGWADISGLGITLDVPAGGVHNVRIPVHIPGDAALGDYDRLRVLAVSKNTPELNDKDDAFTIVGSTIDLATAQLINATWITMPCEQLPCPPPQLIEPLEPVIPVNGIVTYTVLYTNTGISAARNLVLTDTLPHAVEYLSDTLGGPDGEPIPGTLVWELPELLGGNSNVITVWGRVTPKAHQEEVLTNTIEIMSTTPETVTQNNQSWSAFTVRGRIPLAPDDVVIDGPTMGTLDVDLEFTAQIKPAITDTLPITYTWEATGQLPQTHVSSLTEDGLEDAMIYQWTTIGTKQITVTAANALGEVRDIHIIKIVEALPPGTVVITGPVAGSADTVYTFTAHVGQNTATIPLTYTWEATDHPKVTKQNTTLTATMVYSWSTEGQKTITVTAGNVMGVVKDNHTIDITISGYNIYLPLLMREE